MQIKGVTTITQYELRIFEEALTRSLQGDWFSATQTEIDTVINDVRKFLKDRGIRIEHGAAEYQVIPFPEAISLTAKFSNKKYDK